MVDRATRRGRRVFIRAAEAADEAAVIRLARSSRDFYRGLVSPPDTPPRYETYLRRSRADDFEAQVVCRNGDRELMGVFNLSQIYRGDFQSAYLGYYAGAEHAGQGYMGEGLDLLLTHAFGDLGLHRLEANIQPHNDRSRGLVRSRGFRQEGFSPRYLRIDGEWRDHERWALTVEDWRGPSL